MAKVSVLIPSREGKYLANTIQDMVEKAVGEVEVIAVRDGPSSYPLPSKYPNVRIINLLEPHGMRHGINLAASLATGKYLMKIDSHCTISEGYDTTLQNECEDNWVVVARRNELSPEWVVTDTTPVDYFYMSSPWTSPQGYMRMSRWISRDRQRADIMLDETMAFSGSMWFMPKDHFFQRIKTLDEERFGQWSGEPEEISCKTWLGGGKVMINKKVTFAHMRKDKIGRPYHISWGDALIGLRESARYWSSDEWPDRIHNFGWLIDHFWPLPMEHNHCNGERYFWEEDWKVKYYNKPNTTLNNFETPLCELAAKYGSDKCPQIKHHYTPFYYNFFKDKKDQVKKILEIGVGDAEEMAWTEVPGYVTGASLLTWRDFFPNAQIYGADIKPGTIFKSDRIETFLCDQSKEEDLKNLLAKTGTDIDVVIDDGSHQPDHQVFTCRTLMPLLKKDVIYIIEDVGHPEIAERLPEYDCEVPPFKVRARRDDRLLIVKNKNV